MPIFVVPARQSKIFTLTVTQKTYLKVGTELNTLSYAASVPSFVKFLRHRVSCWYDLTRNDPLRQTLHRYIPVSHSSINSRVVY